MLGCRVGCLSSFGTSPLRESFTRGALFPLSLLESDLEVDEFLLAADDDEEEDEDEEDDDEDEEEAAAEPPCKFALVAFLAALGEAPGVGGIDLSEASCTSMTSKLSWLSVLVDFLTEAPPELLDRGRGLGLVSVPCVVVEEDDSATCFAFRICSQRSGRAGPLGLQ